MEWLLLPVLAVLLIALGSRRTATAPEEGAGLAGAQSAGAAPDEVTVATFNIQSGKGDDGIRDLERTAAVLGGVDLVGLQEVAAAAWGGRSNQAEALGGRLGLGWLYAPAERRWFTAYRGNGLLSRLPVGRWRVEPLPNTEGRGFRSLLSVDIDLGSDRRFTLFVTHLAKHEDHDAQLAHVLETLLRAGPALLVGDLNTRRDDPLLTAAVARGVRLALPQERDPGQIDWIVAVGLNVVNARRVATDASDHDPVIATLRWPDDARLADAQSEDA